MKYIHSNSKKQEHTVTYTPLLLYITSVLYFFMLLLYVTSLR